MSSQNEVIRISWEEWKSGRAAKRETLRKLGLDAPSRRPFGHDNRLRAVFGGERAPTEEELSREFDDAFGGSRSQAREAGMVPADITRAISEVRSKHRARWTRA